MSIACTNNDTLSFCPATLNVTCLKVGEYAYRIKLLFLNRSTGAAIDITADDFVMYVWDSLGVLVDTLTIGAGLEIEADNVLYAVLESPVTDEAGTYTHQIDWSPVSTGLPFPAFVGKIVVKA